MATLASKGQARRLLHICRGAPYSELHLRVLEGSPRGLRRGGGGWMSNILFDGCDTPLLQHSVPRTNNPLTRSLRPLLPRTLPVFVNWGRKTSRLYERYPRCETNASTTLRNVLRATTPKRNLSSCTRCWITSPYVSVRFAFRGRPRDRSSSWPAHSEVRPAWYVTPPLSSHPTPSPAPRP